MQLASKLESYRWACGSAGPNQSQANETITELWVSYSVKNTIPKDVIPKHVNY